MVFNDDKWNLEKRFSDFAELDRQLDEIYRGDTKVQVMCRNLTRANEAISRL